MKPLIFSLMAFFAASALAQDKPAPEPKEPAKPEAKKQASAASKKHRRWTEDARHCLELPTNTEIIKCAEEYL
jgi:hypothetical protein